MTLLRGGPRQSGVSVVFVTVLFLTTFFSAPLRAEAPSSALRRLTRYASTASREKRLRDSLMRGDIDGAAVVVIDAAEDNDGDAIVTAFHAAQERSGSAFPVVQVVVRAYAKGLDPAVLERAVENSDVGEEAEKRQTAYIIHSATVALGESAAPETSRVRAPSPAATYVTTNMTYTIGSRSTVVEREDAVRSCRGRKELTCCEESFFTHADCQCDQPYSCRFVIESVRPMIIRDMRRLTPWRCACD